MSRLTIWGVEGIGEISANDQLGEVIANICRQEPNGPLLDNDVLVVTQKIVSKAEGRLVPIDASDPLSHKHLVEQETITAAAFLMRTNFDHAQSRKQFFTTRSYHGQIKLLFRPWWSEERQAHPIHNYVWHIWRARRPAAPPSVWYGYGVTP